MKRILFACSLMVCAALGRAAERPPNILLVMADQMAPQMTGPYGNREVKTPNMDRLGREGVVFTAAYTNSPLCVPARAALMTGRYVSRIGVYDNANPFSSEMPTVAHHLRAAGYETALAGKMHFVGADQLHGFEERLTADIYPADFSWTPEWEGNKTLAIRDGKNNSKAQTALNAQVIESPREMQYDDNTQAAALKWLGERGRAGAGRRPFFLCVSFSDPHAPYQVPKEYWDMYEGVSITIPKVPADMAPHQSLMDQWVNSFHGVNAANMRDPEALYRLRRIYCGQVSYVDRKLGELMECLKAQGELENTAVLFTADHGEMLAERLMIEKRTFYEYSARVPMIGWFPAQWRAGRACGEPVSLIDIFPTLAEVAGAKAPIQIEGRSFANLLQGRTDSGPGRVAIAEYHGEGVVAPCFMLREGNFKYVQITGGEGQLFNLKDDPGEWKNLIGDPKYKDTVEKMRGRIMKEFDPAAIDRDARASQARRLIVREAMNAGTPTKWDYVSPDGKVWREAPKAAATPAKKKKKK